MTSQISTSPVEFTESALLEIKRLLTNETNANLQNLRVGVKGGGCSGMTYVLELGAKESDDVEYEIENVPVIMKNAHAIYLIGITIDYQNGLNNRGFTFNNPNASSTCGCGTSFAV
jgi:iron-sulfur cluster assembly accessory protein